MHIRSSLLGVEVVQWRIQRDTRRLESETGFLICIMEDIISSQ
jgi:hypothetical protein